MNHNELVGWAGGKDEYTVLTLRSTHEYSRSKVRLDISTEIFKKYTPNRAAHGGAIIVSLPFVGLPLGSG